MQYRSGTLGRQFNLLLHTGEDILPVIQDTVDRENIQNGVIVAGLGGFDQYTLQFLSRDADCAATKHWSDVVLQLSSLQGIVENGRVRIGSSVSVDGTAPLTYTGEAGCGCKKLFYCQMMLWEVL